MNLDVYNTHMELYPYQKDDYPALEKMYTATDRFTGNEFPCGYMIENGKLYLPRGTQVAKVEHMCDVKANYITESDSYGKMSHEHSALCEPRNDLQHQSILFLEEENKQAALNLKTGVGKAEPLTARIPTPSGWKTMGDLQVGDYVFGSDGKPVKVIGVYPQGVKDIYEVTFNDGRKVRCCKEHLWTVTRTWPTMKRTVPLERIMVDYKKYSQYTAEHSENRDPYMRTYYVQLLSGPVEYPHRDVPIHPYILGALIGNGCLKEHPLSISSGDIFVPARIAELTGFEVFKYTDRNYTYNFRYPQGHELAGRVVTTAQFFKDLPEMIGTMSHNKRIPDIYMYNDLDTRMELLRGLMDTDGCIQFAEGRLNCKYSSCSYELLTQIQEIVRGLGFICSIGQDKRVEKYRHGFHGTAQIRVPNRFKKELFTHPNKYTIAVKGEHIADTHQKYTHLIIHEIEKVGQEECQCIMVDAPDHLYLTDDFIVTHNTVVVAYASTMLSIKTLIIAPDNGLKEQWINTYYKMFAYQTKDLINIAGGAVMDAIMEGSVPEADVYFATHATLRNYMTEHGGYALHQFFKKLKIGIKVYDESHKEFANILLIDFFSNTDRTWYLTATFDRSDKTESVCFKRAFNSVVAFGEMESQAVVRKHVVYHVVNINSMIEPKQKAKLMGRTGMTATAYGRYAFLEDKKDTAYQAILALLKKVENVEGKVLIFIPLIDAVDEVVKKLKNDWPQKSVSAYHSRMDADDKAGALKKDIIVSTIKSCGTGRDIPGLRCVICAEPIASKVQAEQMIGRLRPYADDKDTYFFDLCDRCIPYINWWWKARYKKIETLVKDTVYLNID